MTENTTNSIPETDPIFSYRTSGRGDIYVYILKSEIANFAVISFDDTASEVAYGVQTLNGYPNLDAKNLVFDAMMKWDVGENPFKELLNDYGAMRRLAEIFKTLKVNEP